ncbi:MAG: haloacid dehalogenase type II [Gammaproteobacteria bacterium]|nr:MAG: haloacid dehalogenase type II [Gammaproteobacteria bacterium]UCH39695.1 MAG: haloacid dehalogenase type II [Gammaproteobacteria bacterium]
MTVALAFDIYGTLIDPHGVVSELQRHVGDRAAEFSRIWREKQLEYTWRRGLMGKYRDFGVCTRQALEYADLLLQTGLDEDAYTALMQAYRVLPAYQDVPASLAKLKQAGHRLYPFSNGTPEMVDAVLKHAAIDEYFEGVISVDSLRTFKPSPEVYGQVIKIAAVEPESCWLVSSNAFDVIGAVAAGIKAAWLKRFDGVIFDPWEFEPTCVIQSLDELPQLVE